ncbi:MAG: tetratricopeptide repeat protein [Candidatus Tectomicrobia bacterium]|nr:tetratricopeptide repeat protein [Candidatus Tectomicrobia bacterium]
MRTAVHWRSEHDGHRKGLVAGRDAAAGGMACLGDRPGSAWPRRLLRDRLRGRTAWALIFVALAAAVAGFSGPGRASVLAASAPSAAPSAPAGSPAIPAEVLPPPALPPGARAALDTTERRLEAWDLAAAREALKEATAAAPRHPETLVMQARLAFYAGEYERSVQLFEEALAAGEKRAEIESSKEFVRATGEATKSLTRRESRHFILALDEARDGILAEYALDTLERAQAALAAMLGFEPTQKVRVEILPDHQSFHAASSLSVRDIEVIGAIGICKFNKVMLLTPRALARGYRWLDALAHEYVHYVIVRLSNNHAPIWFHEGLAKYAEALWRLPASNYLAPVNQNLLAQASSANRFVGFDRMEPSLVDLDTAQEAQLAYAESASAIAYILERYGNAALRQVLAAMREQKEEGAAPAIAQVLKVPFEQFQRQWKEYVAQLKLKPIEGLELLTLKVKGNEGTDERQELAEIKSAVARNHVRLGDRLRDRGRSGAALIEYRRALSKSPYSPPVMAKLARSLLRHGKVEEASELLQRGASLYPDYGPLHVSLADALHQRQRYDEAAEHYREAVAINPYDPLIHRNLAVIARLQGRSDELAREEAVLRKLLGGSPERRSSP